MGVVLKAENISKQYRLGTVGSGTIKDDVTRWWYSLLGKEDPFLKVGDLNDRTQKGRSDYVWALKDINFKVSQGEILGIIGRNGAGKSTLLKILSKVTAPTTGQIKVKGRIASLLEVGTGFHPELTGKENIFLNGAILGMRKHEIARKLDEIVDFAGVERYLETPVKRYSSGMYVRLAFAVAAHLESEILIVDEVLAVGDSEFQKKCLGKMGDVAHGEGRTVLFVSHNMASVKEFCTKGLLMENGMLISEGETQEIVNQYILRNTIKKTFDYASRGDAFTLTAVRILPKEGSIISISKGIVFEVEFNFEKRNANLAVTIEVSSINEVIVFQHGYWIFENKDSEEGKYLLKITLPPDTLNAGVYKLTLIFAENFQEIFLNAKDIEYFEIENETLAKNTQLLPGILRPSLNYNITKI